MSQPQSETPIAVVTGASRGVGRAITLALARAGHHVVACARRPETLEALAGEAAAQGGRVETLALDLGVADAGVRLIDRALSLAGRLDVLVNNAGIAPCQPIADARPELLDDIYALNMRLVHETTWRAWPALITSKGVVLNISSLAARDPFPGFQLYGASKAWLELYTRAVAEEGRAAGVRVHALALGAVETDLLRGLFPDFPEARVLSPEEVAEAALRMIDRAFAPASGESLVLKR